MRVCLLINNRSVLCGNISSLLSDGVQLVSGIEIHVYSDVCVFSQKTASSKFDVVFNPMPTDF